MALTADELGKACEPVLNEVGQVIVGKRETMEKVLAAILTNGHILLEDYPGLAKTLMASCFAQALGCDFKRVQFTPDLLPADITGTYIFNRQSSDFSLHRGPIFTNVLLADEINRAPPKTQAALLEAMQERQVTLEGETCALPRPFFVMATQNPIEYEGTYPLPEAQLDRFLVRLRMGYPSREEEGSILKRRKARGTEEVKVNRVLGRDQLIALQEAVEKVHIDDSIHGYMVDLVQATRGHDHVEVGASPRGTLALMKLSSAMAFMHGRDYVIPDDVKGIASAVLSHRLILVPNYWVRGERPEAVVEAVLKETVVPKVD
jgi:MoxR-like ATPase